MARPRSPLSAVVIPLVFAGVLCGCQQAPSTAYLSPDAAGGVPGAYYNSAAYPAYGVPVPAAEIAPAAGQAPAPQQVKANTGALEDELAKLTERLQRVEKAMLRLDRRMQLVERNELGRMSGGGIEQNAASNAGQISMNAQEEQTAMQEMNIGPAYRDGFRPVSAAETSGAITSSLQAAPRGGEGVATLASSSPVRAAGLPSLADPSPAVGKTPESDLSVWTVRYQSEKIWPERTELPNSRDIVDALRNGQNVTVFARGKHPNAVEFRERVKALSRYLSKVSSLDTLAIATIPAPHLDDNTIEIFATH